MDLKDLIRLLRRGWSTLVIAGLLAVGAGATYFLTADKMYAATTDLFVSVKSVTTDSAGEVVQGSSAAQLKVKSYVEVIRSASVLSPVIKELGLHETPAELASRISTVAPQNTVLIGVTVVDPDPTRAAEIANAVGTSTSNAVDELEKDADGESPVSIRTIEPATTPLVPSSPQLLPVLLSAAVLGMLAGFGLLFLRDRLDTRIHGRKELEELSTVPVIGSIGFDDKAAARPLIVRDDARSPRAESFRALRTNLQFLDPTNPERSFVVTSSLPSEGKTTTTANLAIAIAENGASVVLIDADLRRPKVADTMGIDGTLGLTDALIGRAELDDLIQPWGRHDLAVLPAGSVPPNPSELLGSPGMQALVDELSTRYQYVLIDAPPLLPVTDAAILSRFVRGTLLVASVRRVRRPQLRDALASLERIERSPLGLILTMLPDKGPDSYGYGAYAKYYGADSDLEKEQAPKGRRRDASLDGPVAVTDVR